MYVLRESKQEDINQLLELSKVGMTSLPIKKEAMMRRIEESIAAFAKNSSQNVYLFCLEDCETKKVIGTSAISAAGSRIPTFRIVIEQLPTVTTPHPQDSILLELHEDRENASELCGLVLSESAQSKGIGTLLSKARLLYVADHPHSFHPTLFADIRGVITTEGHCSFWEWVGQTFCSLSFAEVEELYRTQPQELFPLFPRHPIYLGLLPKEIREVVGVAHPKSEGALQMLIKEGFHISNEIHPLDGGPRVVAPLMGIKSIRESIKGRVAATAPKKETKALITKSEGAFRAALGEIEELKNGEIALNEETKRCLELSVGDPIRFLRLK